MLILRWKKPRARRNNGTFDPERIIRLDTAGEATNRSEQLGHRSGLMAIKELNSLELEKAKASTQINRAQAGQHALDLDLPLPISEDMPVDQSTCDGHQPLMDREQVLSSKRIYWIGRRAQDIILSLLALVVLWPVILLLAVIIVIDSPGASPFFVQERIGRDGKSFKFIKLRSMKPNAEAELAKLLAKNEMSGPAFKMKNDPRITRVGKFIRRSGIDELPQLWNILKGDMSVVGPRPALPHEVRMYNDYQRQRLLVQPGLTCYWQIQPHRNDLTFDQWLELDIKYIRERSFLTDWKIIFKTFGTIFSMTGE